jgi:hypothetical protein
MRENKIVNICCCGSSGSTLLAHILNRHPEVACGDEIGLFSKPIIFKNYDLFRSYAQLIKIIGISSTPYFMERSILRNLSSYKIQKQDVWKFIKKTEGAKELVEFLYNKVLQVTGKKIWVEKTPENIFQIKRFNEMYPNAKIIHIVRDPRDVILSLSKRKLSPPRAAMNWLVGVSLIQKINKNKNILEVRY